MSDLFLEDELYDNCQDRPLTRSMQELCDDAIEQKWSASACDSDPVSLEPIPEDLQIRIRIKTKNGYLLKCYNVLLLKQWLKVSEAAGLLPVLPDIRVPLTDSQINRIQRHPAMPVDEAMLEMQQKLRGDCNGNSTTVTAKQKSKCAQTPTRCHYDSSQVMYTT